MLGTLRDVTMGNSGYPLSGGKRGIDTFRFWATVRSVAEPVDAVILELHDKLDSSILEHLFTILQEAVGGAEDNPGKQSTQGTAKTVGVQHLLCDMTDVFFIDSACLPIFCEMRRQLMARGGSLRFFGASRQVARLLQITSLKTYLLEHATEAEALDAIQQMQE
jgi:anti-anti-sigma factor